ncbi:alkaline phosphatase D family protein [Calothrix rhizosoleniae]|uniref:alkaline phosphatase D family protein n=1 Tax=Calothrix rhizosoleniae TaxID=888997 RepID=UPI000B49843A|nr:alkaline phosphatase D family protein [Calothrix rhizosoleniae]
MSHRISRRSFLTLSAAGAGAVVGSQWLDLSLVEANDSLSSGYPVQVGDVTSNRATIWTRGDRNSNLIVQVSTSPNFHHHRTRTIHGGELSIATDFTGQVNVKGLQPGRQYYYRVGYTDRGLRNANFSGEGGFQTAPAPFENQTVRFAWVADLAGQGWGRNPEFEIQSFDGEIIQGGYVVFDVIRKFKPDFAVFQGDMIYADNSIPATKEIPKAIGGGTWINEPAKDFVAITLDEYRANWKYNLGDEKFRRFLAETPIYVEWDDHEVTNNWYPGEILPDGEPYNGISVDTLAAVAEQSLFEYNPIRRKKLFRSFRHGKHLEVFLVDERSFRDPNPENSDPNGIEMLGQKQFKWLKRALRKSKATWKVIATHDPFTIVTGGETDRDSWGQNEQEILGRELQLRELLQFIKHERIKNVVSITADVHFAAAIQTDPDRAIFKDFNPFWEFVIGPINSGAFGPGNLDPSFGPEYKFRRGPGALNLPGNLPPTKTDLQFFGLAEVDGRTAELTVQIRDITGILMYEKTLYPE